MHRLVVLMVVATLTGCATTRHLLSVAGIKGDIQEAHASSVETDQSLDLTDKKLDELGVGTEKIDNLTKEILEFF